MELKTLKDCDVVARALGLRRAATRLNGAPYWTAKDRPGVIVTRTRLAELWNDERSLPAAREAVLKSEDRPTYRAPDRQDDDDATIARALAILEARVARGPAMASPQTVREYLALRAADLDVEVFSILLLDAQNRLIRVEDLFRGTLTQTAVYPREVIRAVLNANAGAVILTHNHPSGLPEPSAPDRLLTEALKQALAQVDVSVLDHIIVAGGRTCSFAERGWI